MTLQEAKTKAENGGWDSSAYDVEQEYSFLLDPLFWQALGKSLGWGSGCNICLKDGITHSYANGFADQCENPKEHLTENHKYLWQINWQRLIDHLADGKSIAEYFETL